MKYIDAEKLKAEIKKMRAINKKALMAGHITSDVFHGRAQAINHLFEFIDSLQQEQTELPGYDKALLEVKSKVDELYEEGSIGLSEYDSGLYNGIAETCMKLRGFIKARLDSDEQPEVDLENYISNKLRELGADLINHKPYSFNRGLNVGNTSAYNDILDRINARKGDS